MSRTLIVEPGAQLDIEDGYGWYEKRQPGLGQRFIEELEIAFSRLVENSASLPGSHASDPKGRHSHLPLPGLFHLQLASRSHSGCGAGGPRPELHRIQAHTMSAQRPGSHPPGRPLKRRASSLGHPPFPEHRFDLPAAPSQLDACGLACHGVI